MSKVIVLGGGVVGASAAFHLAQAGVETVVIDRKDIGRATSAGAGIVAPGTSLREIPGFFELATPAGSYYPELIARLAELDAGETGYAVCGKIFLAESEEEAGDLDRVLALFNQRKVDGVPNMGDIREIDGREARQLFPALRDVPRALHIPDAARVDGGLLRDALIEAARTLGAVFIDGHAEVIVQGGKATGVRVNGDTIEGDRLILAGGAWSNDLFQALGFSLPVAPQKGQIIHIRMPDQDTSAWPILAWFGDQYILAFGPDKVVAGATREFNSGFDTRVTPAGVQHVLNTALRVAPGLGHGTMHEIRVGLRPYAEDGNPFIGMAPGHDNVVISTGHGPSGLQLGPWSGRLAAELAMGREPSSDIGSFGLDRAL